MFETLALCRGQHGEAVRTIPNGRLAHDPDEGLHPISLCEFALWRLFIFIRQDARMATQFDPKEIVKQVSAKLIEKYPDADEATIREIVTEEVAQLEAQPVKDYVSVLSERAAKKRIKAL